MNTAYPVRNNFLIKNIFAACTSLRIRSTSTTLKPIRMTSTLSQTSFISATESRRSIRKLKPTSPVPDSELADLVKNAILNVPSAFNSQTVRMTLILNTDHQKLWSITGKTLLNKIGQERYESGTKARIDGFLKSYGTILFWDDLTASKSLKDNSPDLYKDKTDEWVHQTSGMHQYHMWVALAGLGFGVNLQHYNPLIDAEVRETWNLPEHWALRAQMVFGTPDEGSEAGPKEQKVPIEERVQVFGAKE